MPSKVKYYLYVDETGQDTRGALFIVVVAALRGSEREEVEQRLVEAESISEKGLKKWFKTTPKRREAYLQAILPILRLIQPVYYRIYNAGTDYLPRTAETVVAAISQLNPPVRSSVTTVIDGLQPAEQQAVSRLIRLPVLPYTRTVRGERDQSTPFLRLADALAGFVRHARLDDPYTKQIWQQVRPYLEKV